MTNPYLERGYAPVAEECALPRLATTGRWPAELRGTFYRIGPNPRFPPADGAPYNPLLGDGMVHAFAIDGGAVSYRNRWVRTRRWRLEDAAGRALFGPSGQAADADPSVRGERLDGSANTNLLWHASRLYALEEGFAPIAIDPTTLTTDGAHDFGGALPRNFTAHPKRDPSTGEVWTIANFEDGRFTGYTGVHRIDTAGVLRESRVVVGPHPALIHDFALTERFVVLLFCSVTVSIARLRGGGPALAFEPNRECAIALLPRAGGEPRWCSAPPCMVWHTINAFDDGDDVVLDVCRQDAPMFPREDGASPDPARAAQLPTRWRIASRSVDVTTETLFDEACEYPRIDERRLGRRYRYAYFAGLGGPGTPDIFQRGLLRLDVDRGALQRYSVGAHCAVAEPVHVPGTGEGYLLTNIYEEPSDSSVLALFRAAALQDGPIATAQVGRRVPVGFHGVFVARRAA